MIFTISGRHIEITDAIKKYAREKTSKLPKYYNLINQVEVIVGDGRPGNVSLEIIARGEHSKMFIVTQTGKDVYQCIDAAVRKLERQLTRKKAKERDDKRTGGK